MRTWVWLVGVLVVIAACGPLMRGSDATAGIGGHPRLQASATAMAVQGAMTAQGRPYDSDDLSPESMSVNGIFPMKDTRTSVVDKLGRPEEVTSGQSTVNRVLRNKIQHETIYEYPQRHIRVFFDARGDCVAVSGTSLESASFCLGSRHADPERVRQRLSRLTTAEPPGEFSFTDRRLAGSTVFGLRFRRIEMLRTSTGLRFALTALSWSGCGTAYVHYMRGRQFVNYETWARMHGLEP